MKSPEQIIKSSGSGLGRVAGGDGAAGRLRRHGELRRDARGGATGSQEVASDGDRRSRDGQGLSQRRGAGGFSRARDPQLRAGAGARQAPLVWQGGRTTLRVRQPAAGAVRAVEAIAKTARRASKECLSRSSKHHRCLKAPMLRPEERKKARQFDIELLAVLRDAISSLHSLLDEKIRAISDADITARVTNAIQNSEALRSVADRLDALVTQQETEHQKQERRFQNRSLFVQWALFIATASAFVAAAVYAHIASQQKHTMENTLAEVIKQTKSADISAKAAESAAKTAALTMRLGERAWLVVR